MTSIRVVYACFTFFERDTLSPLSRLSF